jgi:hypothetical protein
MSGLWVARPPSVVPDSRDQRLRWCVEWDARVIGLLTGASFGLHLEGRIVALSLPTGRDQMHARVTSVSGSPTDVDAGIANFREAVVPFARDEGKGAILLVDRQTGKAIAITLWENEQALKASDDRANALRADAAQEMGAAQQPTVERYEVAVFET